MPESPSRRVLVTGSSGKIGQAIIPSLRAAGLEVNGFDIGPPSKGRPNPCPTHYGDLTDTNAVHAAMAGHDTVVHLAANPSSYADLVRGLIGPNIIGLHNVLHAAVDHGVRRVVLASSVQATRRDHRPYRPALDHQDGDNWYALTKVLAEHAGALFHKRHGIDVIAARIGWFLTHNKASLDIQKSNALDAYLSHDDAARFFTAAVTADWSGFHVLYAMSRPQNDQDPEYDLQPGRDLIGYHPEQRFPEGLPDLPAHRASA